MKIYHVETQEDYDALMVELSNKKYEQVTFFMGAYHLYEDDTYVVVDNSRELPLELTYGAYVDNWYKDIPIQEYKAEQKYKADEYVCMPRKKTLSQAINAVVNSPNHYTQGERETIENIRDTMSSEGYQGYCVGNVVKYLARYQFKNGLEDVRKAKKYIEFLEEELMKQEDK